MVTINNPYFNHNQFDRIRIDSTRYYFIEIYLKKVVGVFVY